MKLVRYGEKGAEKPALMDASGMLRDLSAHVDDINGSVLSDASLAKLRALDPASLPIVEGRPRIGACVGNIGKFLCIGLNYSDHAEEAGMPIPAHPILFFKANSAIVGAYDDVMMPRGSVATDWEVELGVVISKPTLHVSKEDAMDHVFGYTIVNDVSERSWQLERGGQWNKGKGYPNFCPTGPILVSKDDIPSPGDLSMRLAVNGKTMQDGSTSTMIFDVPTIVSYLSDFLLLEPGDLICTGTPPGVGMGQSPQRFLNIGDTVELEIDGLGEQAQNVVAAGGLS